MNNTDPGTEATQPRPSLLLRARTFLADNWTVMPFLLFLILQYIGEGAGQAQSGLVKQTSKFFFMSHYGWKANTVSNYLAIMSLPWVIKPFWGLLSDRVPLFGYRRKSWVVLANGVAGLAYLAIWFFGLMSPGIIQIALLTTCIGMAAASTAAGALLVENGKNTGRSATFVNVEWLSFSLAGIVSLIAAGRLCEIHKQSPEVAFHLSSLYTGIILLVVAIACWPLIKEKREHTKPDLKGMATSARSWVTKVLALMRRNPVASVVAVFLTCYYLLPGFSAKVIGALHLGGYSIWILQGALWLGLGAYLWINRTQQAKDLMKKHRMLILVGAFLFLYNFSPGFGDPMYQYMSKSLNFDQDFIGLTDAVNSIGMVIGSFIFMWLQTRMTLKGLLYFSIIAGAAAQAIFIFLARHIDLYLSVVPSALILLVVLAVLAMILFKLRGKLSLKPSLSTVLGIAAALGAMYWGFGYMGGHLHMLPGQLLHVELSNRGLVLLLFMFNGIISMIALVSSLTLAAVNCPDGSEGFSYALLMSVNNLAGPASAMFGSSLYVNVFHEQLNPLIIASAVFTLVALLAMPHLRLGNTRPGEKIKQAA